MRKIFLLVLLVLMGCANERLVALKDQYKNVKAEIPNNCFFLSDYFKYGNDGNLHYVANKYWENHEEKTYWRTLTSDADDDVFYKLQKACEICSEERPEDAAEYKRYEEIILRIQKEREKKVKAAKLVEEENLRKENEKLANVLKDVPNAKEIRVITYGRFQLSRSYYSIARFLIKTNPDTNDFSFSKKEISLTNMYGKFRIYLKETIPNTLVITSMLHPDGSIITDGDAISIWLSVMPE